MTERIAQEKACSVLPDPCHYARYHIPVICTSTSWRGYVEVRIKRHALYMDGVSAAAIKREDGSMVRSSSIMFMNADTIGSMVSTCIGLSEPVGGMLALKEFHDVTLELD